MTGHRRFVVAAFVVLGGFGGWTASAPLGAASPVQAAKDTVPDRLTDQEFWTLSEEMSEANGYFQSDNLLSNEIWFPWIIPDLLARTKPGGGVYLGVGPEQNFNYIAVLKPKMVFITDIRRGNMHTQLMYKALFELSNSRSEFFAMLFTKPLATGLTPQSSAADLVNAYWDLQTVTANDGAKYKANLKAIQDHLTKTHKLPLSDEDLRGIEYVYSNFYWWGPSITYSSSSNARGGNMANYGDLMMATDGQGVLRSYLASEQSFKVLKDLEEKNLLVLL